MSDLLIDAFLSGLPSTDTAAPLDDAVRGALSLQLTRALQGARAAWPSVQIAAEVYARYLAERVRNPLEPMGLERARTSDLYLACACANREPRALAAFRDAYELDIDAVLTAMGIARAEIDEAKQQTNQKLLVAAAGELPRICDYAGEGDLRTWVRVIAVRFALTGLRRRKPEVALEDGALLALWSPDDDPELALVKQTYRAEFKQAFHAAVAGLDARERNVLRMHLIDGLTIDRIGALYRVHRATAFRWIGSARDKVWRHLRRDLSARLGLTRSEQDGLLQDIRSHLDLSLERALRE